MNLLDVNIWLALTFQSHAHHLTARKWFEAEENMGFAFCRMTQQAFLRLSTNPAAFGDEAVKLPEAWQYFDMLMDDPQISLIAEPHGIETFWRQYTLQEAFSPKVWNDAYLASFARTAGYRMVTLDKGFRKFAMLDCKILQVD